MNLKECVLLALEGIRVNKLRSALTMLGIIIGVAAVIAVVAIGQGGQAAVMSSLEKIGTNLFMVYAKGNEQEQTTLDDMITVQDAITAKNNAPDVKYISPVNYQYFPVKYGRKSKRLNLYGVWSEYKYIRNIEIERGRFLTEDDEKGSRRVVIIDRKLAADLFGREEALMKQVDIFGVPMTIVGITKWDDNFLMGGPNQPSTAYIPFSTYNQMTGWNYAMYLEASAANKDKVESAMEQVKGILHRRHHSVDKYAAVSLQSEMEEINKIMGILQLIIGSVAAISLLVGGIGVMNIMLVSGTERTREIGIRKALGAQYKDIMTQFLIEAVVICSLGGTVGILLGLGGGMIVAAIARFPSLVSPLTILIAFGFSAAIGIFFGLYPASKAARLDPIEALRHE